MDTIDLNFQERDEAEMLSRSHSFEQLMQNRRTVRDFSDRAVPKQIIENCLLTANSAPSGANPTTLAFCSCKRPRSKTEKSALPLKKKKRSFTLTVLRMNGLQILISSGPIGINRFWKQHLI